MEYIAWALVHLSLWGLILLAAAGIGHFLLRKHPFNSTVEQVVFTLALGLGTSALIIFLLGLMRLMYTGVLIGLTIPWAVYTLVKLVREFNGSRIRDLWSRLRTCPRVALFFKSILVLIGIGYWLCLLANTQYPPRAWDATDEHLLVAREFLAAHQPVALPGIIEPVLPNLNHVLFAWGMALRDDIIAQMIEHTFLMLTALGLYAWGRRRDSFWFGVALAAFWLGCPVVLWLAESAYVDLCVVCFAFLGVYALRVFWEKRDTRWWYLAMALCGMAAGAKLPGLIFAAAGMFTGLLALALNRLRGKQGNGEKAGTKQMELEPLKLKPLALGWVLCLLVIAPWYGFIFFHTGNPVWPAFAQYSRGVWASPDLVKSMGILISHAPEPRTVKSFLMLPIKWNKEPLSFGIGMPAPLNPLILIWPLAWLLALWNREVRWWAVWAFGFTLYWFMSAQELRYWLPALPLCGVALFESLRWIITRTRTLRWSPAVFLLLAVASLWWGVSYIVPILQVKRMPPVTAQERERFLSLLGGFDAVSYINRHQKQGDVVAVVYGTWLAYYIQPPVFDLFGMLQIRPDTFPRYSWPEDKQWMSWIESNNCNWILVVHAGAPEFIVKQNADPAANEFWPNYQLVYTEKGAWVFRHKPVPPDVAVDLIGPVTKSPNQSGASNLNPDAKAHFRGTTTQGIHRPSVAAFLLGNDFRKMDPDLSITTSGVPGHIPISGDWNGDGVTTVGMYAPDTSTFYLKAANTTASEQQPVQYGNPGDKPVVGDWNGDGVTTLGVYRPSNSTFYLRNSNTSGEPEITVTFGESGDIAVAGDWDGDGKETIGVYRPGNSTFYLRNANLSGDINAKAKSKGEKSDAIVVVVYGQSGDIPLAGDWNGDGITTIGTFRPSNSTFYFRNSNTSGEPDIVISFGVKDDVPVVGDWDGN